MKDPGAKPDSSISQTSLMVGLTGGIACGKSHSIKVFAESGAHVLDADEIAHQVIKSGNPAHRQIVEHFGDTVLDASGEIDRKTLGARIFSDAKARRILNSIVHPRVIEREKHLSGEIMARVGHCIIIVDAALMIEAKYHTRFDKLIVVHCRPELQVYRLVMRDTLSHKEALARIATQMQLSEKLKLADYVIETSGTYKQTRAQIEAIYAMLMNDLRDKMGD